ncbi:MAG: cytochrome b/b6 domain-containing protein [Sulfurimonas sp.]|uniref:cytochrome b n=1 Tax=Sulfurimonas sp. TaxID=2022749 RepID=UPI002619D83A|nr:cytochrome b/b6 domain-containing protein [Sulfurimonas sp.]MCW8895710.1 cytochrome b/b6 domain-containing protein [Sulfurimonas sp.]MCW8953690.1 cytochrome b/b6 domain-containing protein [Sulfurimonas sp.]MCW9068242.1 cytochrome b/b6 domain-containing protein [Sulfurimonas sp.]
MKYTIQFRIWHWLNAIVILGLLATFFLRKTFLSWRTNSEILMTKLSEVGIEITAEQAKMLAKAVRAGMWEWHIIFGYALAFLVLYRIYLFFADTSEKVNFDSLDMHHKAVKISYYLFYAILLFMTVSGLGIHFYQELGMSKDFAGSIKDIHENVAYVVAVFVPLHIAGTFVADATDEKGLVSTMIHGKKID